MNSTTVKRTWIEWKAPREAQDRNNEKRKEPYKVPTRIEAERRWPKKEA